ncbi:MAG TPA: type I polyketide synthase, partial [Vicinamibacterales bacterium]|nr:type I polyketide synthase [Vicinamibacterales bacterium]
SLSTYLTSNLGHSEVVQRSASSSQIGIGNLQDYLATRVSYKLNLKGPAYAVQSACSTSLLAVHLACQHLLNFECDLALAGGVSIPVPMRVGYLYQDGGVLSPDGHCRPFSAEAGGTVFGSGAGAVLLKRLDEAVADGDTIYAVVIGSAVNNDGALKAGYTAPSVAGQAAVITEALAAAGVPPDTIGYVEAHGTGTILGDPVEVTALTQAFRTAAAGRGFCGLGSVKSNIGHLDAAAGIAGFIKTVLALHHRELPPTLHAEPANPRIDFAASPFHVNTTLKPWPGTGAPRRAGVSAFGVGGTNVHVILEEAPAPADPGPARPWQLLVLSARTEPALESATTNLLDWLEDRPDVPLADVAWTLQVGRRTGEHRRFVVCRDVEDAADKLDAMSPREVFSAFQKAAARSVVFLFPGQGAQHPGMAAELYRHEPAFRETFDRCAALFEAALGFDLREVLFAPASDQAAAERLARTHDAEPALFAVEYALARLWMSWGVTPQAMIGHSIGEYVAACLADVFSLEDAARLVAARARLVGGLPEGAMLAVSRPPDEVRPMLGPSLSVAIINTPASCVVAGDPAAVDDLARALDAQGIAAARLDTQHAFHSVMMDPVLADFAAVVRQVTLHPPAIPFMSNVTGGRVTDAEATDPAYWVRQLRLPVYFADGIRELLKDPSRVLLEVGPGQTLVTLTRQNMERGRTSTIVNSLPDPRERRSDLAAALGALGRLWLAGVPVDWTGVHAGERRRRVPLPTYAFDRQKYWIEATARTETAAAAPDRKADPDRWFYVPGWKEAPRAVRAADAPEDWLVLGGPDRFSAGLATHLAGQARRVALAQAGSTFARVGPSTW